MTEGWRGWDDYAPFYDWENARTLQRRDVAFWQRLACAQDGPVLELGCGTGRIAVPVARGGARIVGIDRSEEMLARARKRVARARVGRYLSLVRGDIRELPFTRRTKFSAVLAAYGILQSLTRERDLTRTFASVARVLRRGGLFAIDVVPDLPKWEEYRNRTSLSGRQGRDTTLTLVETVRQDRARRLTIF
ncbi:MAG: methyltransferase domain-containing protein, partial [Acidobacteria bacterium]|nr:methyltransferase domain-containing protein [Acidobacteriota bacterium]